MVNSRWIKCLRKKKIYLASYLLVTLKPLLRAILPSFIYFFISLYSLISGVCRILFFTRCFGITTCFAGGRFNIF